MLYAFIIRNTEGKHIDDKIFSSQASDSTQPCVELNLRIENRSYTKTLGRNRTDILEGQISVSKEDRGFNRQQKEEELNKLTWCETHSAYVDSLFHLEDHHLLYGCTAIADLGKPDMIEKLRTFLNIELQTISRALLTYGDYGQTINNYKQIGNGAEDVWKQLLHPSNQRGGFENTQA